MFRVWRNSWWESCAVSCCCWLLPLAIAVSYCCWLLLLALANGWRYSTRPGFSPKKWD